MKKLISLFLCAAFALPFAGCGGSHSQLDNSASAAASSPAASGASGPSSGSMDTLDSLGDIEVEKELFDVTITVPADFVGETTQEELDASVEEGKLHSATLNEDGSITYVMSKSQHKQLLAEIAAGFDEALSAMAGSEDYPNITDIKANDDYTSFTVTTTSTELSLQESFSVLSFYIYGGMYAIFSGEPAENIHVDFVNADTGMVIESADSKDAGGSK